MDDLNRRLDRYADFAFDIGMLVRASRSHPGDIEAKAVMFEKVVRLYFGLARDILSEVSGPSQLPEVAEAV